MGLSAVAFLTKFSGVWPFTVADGKLLQLSMPLSLWNTCLFFSLLFGLYKQLPGHNHPDGLTKMAYYIIDVTTTVHACLALMLPLFKRKEYEVNWRKCLKMNIELAELTIQSKNVNDKPFKLIGLCVINGLMIAVEAVTNGKQLFPKLRWILVIIPLLMDMSLLFAFDYWMTQLENYLKWVNRELSTMIQSVFWERQIDQLHQLMIIYFKTFEFSEEIASKFGLHLVYLFLVYSLRVTCNIYQLASDILVPPASQIIWIFFRIFVLLHICYCTKVVDTQCGQLSYCISKAWNRIKADSRIAGDVQWFGVMSTHCCIRRPGDIYFKISFMNLFETIGTITTTAVIFAQATKLSQT